MSSAVRTSRPFGHLGRGLISAAGMFETRARGSCSSSAIYLTGCLRALGVPTRIVLVIPAIDANDANTGAHVRRAGASCGRRSGPRRPNPGAHHRRLPGLS